VAQPAQDVPGRVAVQDLLLLGVSPGGGGLRGPAFELDEVLVAGGQRSGGDQDAAQMVSGLPAGSSSGAAWVSGRRPAASPVSMACEVALESQARTVAGRSVVASVWPPFPPSGAGGASVPAAGLASQIFSFTSAIRSLTDANSAWRATSRRTFSTSAAASCRPTVPRPRAVRVHKNPGPWPG
jgi:hypothetical protein